LRFCGLGIEECCVVFFCDQGASFVNLVGRMPKERKAALNLGTKLLEFD
jgi:hypothetical protein